MRTRNNKGREKWRECERDRKKNSEEERKKGN